MAAKQHQIQHRWTVRRRALPFFMSHSWCQTLTHHKGMGLGMDPIIYTAVWSWMWTKGRVSKHHSLHPTFACTSPPFIMRPAALDMREVIASSELAQDPLLYLEQQGDWAFLSSSLAACCAGCLLKPMMNVLHSSCSFSV